MPAPAHPPDTHSAAPHPHRAQYATRVSTIRNDVSKHENSTEVLKLKKQIDYWKEQAGLPPHKRDYVDLEEIADGKQNGPDAA